MVQQNIDKRVTSCTHATQKRQSLLDNSQHSRVWVWRIVDQCLPASQITCRLGVPSAIASRLGSQHVLSTQHEQAYGFRPTPVRSPNDIRQQVWRYEIAGSLPVTLPESNNASLGSGYQNCQNRPQASNFPFHYLHSLCNAVCRQHSPRKPRRGAGRLSTSPDTGFMSNSCPSVTQFSTAYRFF